MKQEMRDALDKFFAEKTIVDVNRDTFLICNLNDRGNKLTVSLVFLRDWDSLETDQYNVVILQNKGAVFTFPCYWVSIPKELAMTYIEYAIDELYSAQNWDNGDSGSDNNSGCNCPCGTV